MIGNLIPIAHAGSADLATNPDAISAPLDDYRIQYVGYLQNGRRFIYLNAFKHYAFGGTWRTTPVAALVRAWSTAEVNPINL